MIRNLKYSLAMVTSLFCLPSIAMAEDYFKKYAGKIPVCKYLKSAVNVMKLWGIDAPEESSRRWRVLADSSSNFVSCKDKYRKFEFFFGQEMQRHILNYLANEQYDHEF